MLKSCLCIHSMFWFYLQHLLFLPLCRLHGYFYFISRSFNALLCFLILSIEHFDAKQYTKFVSFAFFFGWRHSIHNKCESIRVNLWQRTLCRNKYSLCVWVHIWFKWWFEWHNDYIFCLSGHLNKWSKNWNVIDWSL